MNKWHYVITADFGAGFNLATANALFATGKTGLAWMFLVFGAILYVRGWFVRLSDETKNPSQGGA